MRKVLYTSAVFCAFFIFFLEEGIPADFTVNPVRIFFEPGQKTDIITVKNLSDEKFSLQLSVFSWGQDAEGENLYTATNELIFFPKIFTVEKDEERLIRIGTRVPPGEKEKTYRIFLEEIPQPQAAPPAGTGVRTLMRLGVPVFIAPVKTGVAAAVEGIELKKGRLSLSVKNTGNVHFIVRAVKVEGLDAQGATAFQMEIAGWYVLEGREKTFSMEIPKENCQNINSLNIDVITDRLSMNKRHDVSKEMCSP